MRLIPCVLAGALGARLPGAIGAVTTTVDLDLQRYAGRWYEIARLPMIFQRPGDRNITATYIPQHDGTVAVHNACTGRGGRQRGVEGVACRPDPAHGAAKLKVRFAPSWLAFLPGVWADYWVLALDPDYQWAMVGEPRRKYLWLLSRSPTLERAQFEALTTQARAMGYDLRKLLISGALTP